MVAIPRPQAAIADRAGLPTREWYTYLLDLANSAGMTPAQREQLDVLIARVDALDGGAGGNVSVQGLGSIVTNGIDVVLVTLDGDNDAPGSSWYYGTGPDGVKGWYAIADALAVTADLTKAVDEGTGVATFGLADLPDSGTGTAIYKTTRDAKGRTSGQVAATTTDLPEGTNLYFTTERGQDAAGASITAGTFDGLTLTYDDAGNRINGANTDKGSTAIAAHVAQADPHPQYTTNAEAAAAAPVQSVNGATGTVSVTPANIGAATAAQGAKADSALQEVRPGTNVTIDNTDPRRPIVSAAAASGLPEAPINGYPYVRKDGVWEQTNGPSARFWLIEYPLLTDQAGNQLTDQAGNTLMGNSPIIPPGWPASTTVAAASSSTTIPAMTLAQANALASPADFQMVAITDLTGGREPCWYDATVASGTKWRRFSDRSIAS